MTSKSIRQFSAVLLMLGLLSVFTYAADIDVTCSDKSGCSASPVNTPLFSEHLIKPLWTVTKTVKVTSKYNETRQVFVNINDIPFDSFKINKSLAKVLNIVIKEVESGKTIWSGTLSTMNDKGSLSLTTIPKNSSRNYKFTASLPNVGNDYQNKQAKFDMFVGFVTDKEGNDGHGGPRGDQNWPPDVLGDHNFRGFFNQCFNYLNQFFSRFTHH